MPNIYVFRCLLPFSPARNRLVALGWQHQSVSASQASDICTLSGPTSGVITPYNKLKLSATSKQRLAAASGWDLRVFWMPFSMFWANRSHRRSRSRSFPALRPQPPRKIMFTNYFAFRGCRRFAGCYQVDVPHQKWSSVAVDRQLVRSAGCAVCLFVATTVADVSRNVTAAMSMSVLISTAPSALLFRPSVSARAYVRLCVWIRISVVRSPAESSV